MEYVYTPQGINKTKVINGKINTLKDESIFFRICIHIGDILISDDDVLGDGVNIASRIESLAEPNGVTISDDTYRQIKDKLNMIEKQKIYGISYASRDFIRCKEKTNVFKNSGYFDYFDNWGSSY